MIISLTDRTVRGSLSIFDSEFLGSRVCISWKGDKVNTTVPGLRDKELGEIIPMEERLRKSIEEMCHYDVKLIKAELVEDEILGDKTELMVKGDDGELFAGMLKPSLVHAVGVDEDDALEALKSVEEVLKKSYEIVVRAVASYC